MDGFSFPVVIGEAVEQFKGNLENKCQFDIVQLSGCRSEEGVVLRMGAKPPFWNELLVHGFPLVYKLQSEADSPDFLMMLNYINLRTVDVTAPT